jgi:hypothetical protein
MFQSGYAELTTTQKVGVLIEEKADGRTGSLGADSESALH